MIDQAPPEWHDPIPGRHYGDAYKPTVSIAEADRRSVRSFWRGLLIGANIMVWCILIVALLS
jgi:hypothetical protein